MDHNVFSNTMKWLPYHKLLLNSLNPIFQKIIQILLGYFEIFKIIYFVCIDFNQVSFAVIFMMLTIHKSVSCQSCLMEWLSVDEKLMIS